MKELAVLDQTTFIKGKRLFVLQDDGTLKVSSSYAGKTQEFSVEVGHFKPEPLRDKTSARHMIVGMGIFIFIGLLFAIPAVIPHTAWEARFVFGGIAGLFLICTLLCWREYIRQSYDVYAFQDVFTGQSINFLANKPTEEIFKSFIDKFKSEIVSKRQQNTSSCPSLVDQIKELGKLNTQGLLTDEEFSKAKNKLIESSGSGATIGFKK